MYQNNDTTGPGGDIAHHLQRPFQKKFTTFSHLAGLTLNIEELGEILKIFQADIKKFSLNIDCTKN